MEMPRRPVRSGVLCGLLLAGGCHSAPEAGDDGAWSHVFRVLDGERLGSSDARYEPLLKASK